LSAFSKEGVGIVTDYRVMETITIFVISIGGMLISIFLPKTSKLIFEGDQQKIQQFAIKGTLFTSIICCILCFPIMLNSKEILNLYVGKEYINLAFWLNFWIFTILFYLHNSPVSSIVLATGKTKMLVYSTAFSSIISLIINAWLCSTIGVGSAVVGYSVYILLQMSFYYLYYNRRILNLNSWKIFKSFIIPVSLGSFLFLLVQFGGIKVDNVFGAIILKSSIWTVAFVIGLILFKIIRIGDILNGSIFQ
jgi:O-antigen/teichoic acid export membrane protein